MNKKGREHQVLRQAPEVGRNGKFVSEGKLIAPSLLSPIMKKMPVELHSALGNAVAWHPDASSLSCCKAVVVWAPAVGLQTVSE